MSSRAIRTLYRLCLRQAAELQRNGLLLEFRRPMDRQAWMLGQKSFRWGQPSPAYNVDALRSLLPWAADAAAGPEAVGGAGATQGAFTPSEVRELVRQHFRHPAEVESETEYIDRAIATLRVLSDQVYLAQCTSRCETEGVVVEVTSQFIGKESELDPMFEPDETLPEKNLFTYRVRVANVGDKLVQLMARHWVVKDSQGRTTTELPRWSPGVVGLRPVLDPGKCFEYYSRTDLDTREGTMLGAFQMGELDIEARQLEPVRLFEAEVAPFRLAVPPGA